jgi:hypothetical protein
MLTSEKRRREVALNRKGLEEPRQTQRGSAHGQSLLADPFIRKLESICNVSVRFFEPDLGAGMHPEHERLRRRIADIVEYWMASCDFLCHFRTARRGEQTLTVEDHSMTLVVRRKRVT